ncbi:MAG: hypothetical protein HDS16_06820 [Bacteroides sp.]|nr:hypothetical protein [Bacteroides sp.]
MMKNNIKSGCRLLSILIVSLLVSLAGRAMRPDDVPYRAADGRVMTVIDPASLLSPSVRSQLTDSLEQLRLRSTAEVELVVVPDLDGMDPNQWCEKLFTRLKIGKEKEDNGLLIMISPGARQTYIMTGYGMEGIFPDIVCKRLADNVIVPAMRQNDLDAAARGIVSSVSQIISDPTAAAEIASGQKEKYNGELEALDGEVFLKLIKWLAAIFFTVAAIWFFVMLCRRKRGMTNYEKSLMWRKSLMIQAVFTILSLGAGIIFLFLSFILYRWWRTRKIKCPTCGSKMHRLSESMDNEFLTPAQDFEEKLNTIDWDVWKCDSCGTIERLPFKVPQKKYTECPNCHTVAMCLESDAVTRPASKYAEGEGVRTYVCKYCNHHDRKKYRIPRKLDDASLAAAAAIGAAAASAGRRGGGGFGGGGGGFGGFGGFGGGATGGGGAGSSW